MNKALSYYEDTDSLYIHLVDRPGIEAREVAPGIVFDFDTEGNPVGIDIDHAQNILDLTTLEAESLPCWSYARTNSLQPTV